MSQPMYERVLVGSISVKTMGIIAFGIVCLLMGGRANACSDVDCGHPPAIPDNNADCGMHNMMLVGEKAIFLSHLPMFRSEHRFQVILEATFSKDGKSLDEIYTNDRKEHPNTKMYTVEPVDRFILSRVFTPETVSQLRSTFAGKVYRGHLERHGQPINGLTDVDVKITQVVYARELRPDDTRSDALEYILFGKPGDLFLAHRITRGPDFDQILSVTVNGQSFTESELQRGMTITIPHRTNAAASRLRPNESVGAEIHSTEAQLVPPLTIQVNTEYYFEEGELFVRAEFEPTSLETEAGF